MVWSWKPDWNGRKTKIGQTQKYWDKTDSAYSGRAVLTTAAMGSLSEAPPASSNGETRRRIGEYSQTAV